MAQKVKQRNFSFKKVLKLSFFIRGMEVGNKCKNLSTIIISKIIPARTKNTRTRGVNTTIKLLI